MEWTLADARERFSELIKRALSEGPQRVHRRGDDAVVVIAEDEYERHVGWGHSSIRHAVRFAEQAGAGRVLLSHHDPSRTDDRMDEHLARGVALARAVEVAAAVEGAEIDLRASGAAVESGRPGS